MSEHIDAIQLTKAEVQANYDRVRWAEGLIEELPRDHEGANSWLLHYGTGRRAVEIQTQHLERQQAKHREVKK